MRSWLRELLATPRHEYPAFVAALSLVVVLPPEDVAALLNTRLTRVEEQAAAIEKQRDDVVDDGVHPLFLVEDDYRVALLRAERTFLAELLDRINDPESGWVRAWSNYHSGNTPKP
jgi:hypothetical protein